VHEKPLFQVMNVILNLAARLINLQHERNVLIRAFPPAKIGVKGSPACLKRLGFRVKFSDSQT
jgi:hypothetical protein